MTVTVDGRLGVLFTETIGRQFELRACDSEKDLATKAWNDHNDADAFVTICGVVFAVERVLDCEEQHYFLPAPGETECINRGEVVTRLDPCTVAGFCVHMGPLHQACLESDGPTAEILGLVGFPHVP